MSAKTAIQPLVLIVSYAFPPMAVPMAACVAKTAAAIQAVGHELEVFTVSPLPPLDSPPYVDESLLPYVEAHFAAHMTALKATPASAGLYANWKQYGTAVMLSRILRSLSSKAPIRYLRLHMLVERWFRCPDLMQPMHVPTYRALRKKLESTPAATIITFSPFHSINPVIVRLKKKFPHMQWIAQFSDPWAHNPLDHDAYARAWAKRMEPKTLKAADHIVYNSEATRALMMQHYGDQLRDKSTIIPHPFDAGLYPQRAKKKNSVITLRHVGALFEDRTPEPVFLALNHLFSRHPDWKNALKIELVGAIDPAMLATHAAQALPDGVVQSLPSVPYVASLEAIYDADILLLIEANVANHLFMPSKLSDYFGAGAPILAIIPEGPAMHVLKRMHYPYIANPEDPEAISYALEALILKIQDGEGADARVHSEADQEFSSLAVGKHYSTLLETLNNV